MKIYLDDERECPKGWYKVEWPEEMIKFLKQGNVSEISLDHDLGEDKRNGYDVLLWIEEQVFLNDYIPPIINIHTANSSARIKMELALKKIQELINVKK